ncbi:hypothetical protein TSMEX_006823 [Taenia solium]|eukprot:TsM_000293900 transcript=TsM_000293900 gene=TsM_000293900
MCSVLLWGCELKVAGHMVVGGTVASWSTGYALDVTARIPSTAPAIQMNLLGFIVSTAICLNIFVTSLLLLILKCCKSQL